MRPYRSRSTCIVGGAGICVALMLEVAQAIPLDYAESVSGDLDARPTAAFSLDIGDNTISGSTYFGVNVPERPHFDADFDSFAFSLPFGTQLANITLTFATALRNSVSAYADERLCPGIGYCLDDVLGTQTVSFVDAAPLHVDFEQALPLTGGTYSLIANAMGIGAVIDPSLPEWWAADYSWTLQVISVPEPKSFPLLGLGFIGLIVMRRTRRSERLPYFGTDFTSI